MADRLDLRQTRGLYCYFPATCASTFLDWEPAPWGDPVYNLAVHIHKMAYLPEEHGALVSRWLERCPEMFAV
jgi:hypothetical protein